MRDCDFYVPAKEYTGQTCPEHGTKLRKVRRELQLKPGLVDWPAVQARLRRQGIVLFGGGADEAPEVYKRLPEVLAVIGSAFGFRALARRTIGLVPLVGWAVKGVVGYTGTRAIGEAAVRYFERRAPVTKVAGDRVRFPA